jgi:DNA invertase Pin-like site-specific DNA recombinase
MRQVETAKTLLGDGKLSATEVAKTLGVSRATLYRYLVEEKRNEEAK